MDVRVTDKKYGAKGNGTDNDREPIQNAIDDVYRSGGGRVFLDDGKTFVSGGIVLRSNVSIVFGEGTVLQQSSNKADYVKPVGESYVPYEPLCGHNFSDSIKWSHVWYLNYPFIFAPEGSHDFSVRGNGIIRMMDGTDDNEVMKNCPIGFFRVHHFEICDVTITNYHGYAMMPFTCSDGLISNVKINKWSFGNGDGVCMMNCRNMRITGCKMFTGDDSVYIFSSYMDPRKSEWWNSDNPQPSENIEIDHNDLESNNCKAFGMILWGIECPDLEKIEVRNVYVHDNHFKTMGNWIFNPYTKKDIPHPVTTVRFENNIIDQIETNFFETVMSDVNYYHSMDRFRNEFFNDGKIFWAYQKNKSENSIKIEKRMYEGNNVNCCILSDMEQGKVSVYQGLYIKAANPSVFMVTARTSGVTCRMFVKDLDTGDYIKYTDFNNTEFKEINMIFDVPKDGNYHLGVESLEENPGSAVIRRVELKGNNDRAFGFSRVEYNNGKLIYIFNE